MGLNHRCLFAQSTLRELASATLSRRFFEGLPIAASNEDVPLSEVFEQLYLELRTNYRNEYFYKNELLSKIVFSKHSPRTTSFQTEFRVGRCVADLAVFNGTSSAYEIKTELDTFRRLEVQISEYLLVFDRVHVVTSERLADAVLGAVNPVVGVLCLREDGALCQVRSARGNAQNVSPDSIFKSLRRSEYESILNDQFGWTSASAPGVAYNAARKLFGQLPPVEAHELALKQLRRRTTSPSFSTFLAALPKSVRAMAPAIPFSAKGSERVLERMGMPLKRLTR